MQRIFTKNAMLAAIALTLSTGAVLEEARADNISFTQLNGVTGGTPAATGVYRADLSGLGAVRSVTIRDGSNLAGSAGQFSGFDLDAIVLSSTLISNASQVSSLVRAGTFNFATSLVTPGAQMAPASSALFGTSGSQVNNAVATLDSFDGNSTTNIPGAFGFFSLGVGGELTIDLTSALLAGGPLYLYIGEVGNNGEVATGTIDVSPVSAVPGPIVGAGLPGLMLAGAGLLGWRRRKRKAAA
jgi:LPXTG-motif cell wall-anchored protein